MPLPLSDPTSEYVSWLSSPQVRLAGLAFPVAPCHLSSQGFAACPLGRLASSPAGAGLPICQLSRGQEKVQFTDVSFSEAGARLL